MPKIDPSSSAKINESYELQETRSGAPFAGRASASQASVLPMHIQDVTHGAGPSSAQRSPHTQPMSARDAHDRVTPQPFGHVIDMFALEELTRTPAFEPVPSDITQALNAHREDGAISETGVVPRSSQKDADQAAHTLEGRFTVSAEMVYEETRPIDRGDMGLFRTLQREAIEDGKLEHMPQLRDLLLKMNVLDKNEFESGAREAGAWLSWRNVPGNLINLMPLAFLFAATSEENKEKYGTQVGLMGAYMITSIGAQLAGALINPESLIAGTPFVDASANGAPDIKPELASTPGFEEIKQELEDLLKLISNHSEVQQAFNEFNANRQDPARQEALQAALDKAQKQENDAPARTHFTSRSNVQRTYIKGTQGSALFSTAQAVGNWAGGLVGALANNPRLAAYIQIGTTVMRIVGQRLITPSDEVKLFNMMWELEILSRKLTGDDQADEQIIKGMVRSPLKVRANSLQGIAVYDNERLEQDIAQTLLKANPALGHPLPGEATAPGKKPDPLVVALTKFRTQQDLQERHSYAAKRDALRRQMVAQASKLVAREGDGLMTAIENASAAQRPELIEQVVTRLGITTQEYMQFTQFQQRGMEEMDETSMQAMGRIGEKIAIARDGMSLDEQYEIAGMRGLYSDLIMARANRDDRRQRELCSFIAQKLEMDASAVEELHFLEHHPLDELSPDEQDTLAAIKQQTDHARNELAKEGKDKNLAKLEARYQEIRRDPVLIGEREFGKVSNEHAKLVHDGMQVTRNEGLFKLKKETYMLIRDGGRRIANAPEFICNVWANVHRSFQNFGLSGSSSPVMLNSVAGFLISIARYASKNPATFESPVWPRAITSVVWAGAFALNLRAGLQVKKALISPLTFSEQLSVIFGPYSAFAETSHQNMKLSVRDDRQKNDDYQIRGFGNVITRHAGEIVFGGFGGLNGIYKTGNAAVSAAKANDDVVKQVQSNRSTRLRMEQQLSAARAEGGQSKSDSAATAKK